jgi:transcriptional regulator with XRE-family HTH domain
MFKRMLGEAIYRLRKEKGLSQAELGGLIGVSNKAVSKWETFEANSDITLLPLLARTLGVTTDELLTDIKAEKSNLKLTEIKYFGMEGVEINTPEEYEFISD